LYKIAKTPGLFSGILYNGEWGDEACIKKKKRKVSREKRNNYNGWTRTGGKKKKVNMSTKYGDVGTSSKQPSVA
jgi:hypothetical protein